MTDFKSIDVRRDSRGVVRLELARPHKRNALSTEMIAELTAFARAVQPGADRVVVLSGAGAVFCAGADLGWMKAQIEADRATRIAEAGRLAEMLAALDALPIPLIGRVHGGAFGGGVGLACVCDVAVAEEGARFAFSETRLGLVPATIAPYVLARIGEGAARRLFLSARVFGADEALACGVVSRVVEAGSLDAAVEAELIPFLSVAPGAVGAAKSMIRSFKSAADADQIRVSIERLADIWEGEEATHGVECFLNGRKPRWSGG